MRKSLSLAIGAALAVAAATPAQAWGPIGHRITGAIADDNLSSVARSNIQSLLGTESLAEASTWPDDMRSNPDPFWQKDANFWHYVTVGGDEYHASDAPADGDALTALEQFSAILRDANASVPDKQRAVRFIVHIVGDLHQPLHAGAGDDRGGNLVSVTWFGQRTNLHSLWDSALVEHRKLSYSEYYSWLSRTISPEDIAALSDPDPKIWIQESIALRKVIYPSDPSLSWDYAYQFQDALEDRLKRAGIRIAAYLNWVFEGA